MDDLSSANERLKTAHDNRERDYAAQIIEQEDCENELTKRMDELNKKKHEVAKANGNTEAGDDDLVEINAGGKVIAAKRSTLTQLKGTRLEALFSGRWDKKLQRDGNGRIFLDVNPKCFQAIVDYLNELTISSVDDPPAFPCVDDEHKYILRHQMELFGLMDQMSMLQMLDSNIVKDETKATQLCDWLKEDESHGELRLLYRSSRDGRDDSIFHSKCDNMGCTLTIIETTDGYVFGGYSNTAWSCSQSAAAAANKAFLFALSGSCISPCKMKLKNSNDTWGIYNHSSYGPTFGGGHDLVVQGQDVYPTIGSSYEVCPNYDLTSGNRYTIKEMEVFQVTAAQTPATKKAHHKTSKVEPITRFSKDINDALEQNKSVFYRQSQKCSTLKRASTTNKHLLINLHVEIQKMLLC